jgi:hypothetical protein
MMSLLAALPALSQQLPATVVNGRFFYEPIVGTQRLRIWLDTDGSGFVTQRCVQRLGLSANANHVALPPVVVQPTTSDGRFPIIDPDASDKIFAGLDAQFGATWFGGRIVALDYARGRLELLNAIVLPLGALGQAPLRFPQDTHGVRIEGRQYPSVEVTLPDGSRVAMSFDTAATVALTPATTKLLNDQWGAVRATSFLTHTAMNAWHEAHPDWRFLSNAGGEGVDMLLVPGVTIGTYRARGVWFTTRPNDDVFDGESVAGKIGPTAWARTRITLDYPGAIVYFDK